MSDIVLMGDPRVAAIPVRAMADNPADELVDVRDATDLLVDDREQRPDTAYAHLRRGLAERLQQAQGNLPGGLRLLLVEGCRPYALQEHYFARYRARLEAADPTLDLEASFLLASRYVSPPEVAPHVCGAAIDLTLADASGLPLDLGTEIDASPEDCNGACYFGADNISREARHHRQVLAAALESAGIVNYPTEWWHWSYGDRYWALVTGAPAAIYGPVTTDVW